MSPKSSNAFVTLIISLLCLSCKSTRLSSDRNEVNNVSNDSLEIRDISVIDTASNLNSYNGGFKSGSVIVNTLKPYFTSNLIKPGDVNNKVYETYISEGKALETEVINRLLEFLPSRSNWRREIEARIGSIDLLKDCQVKLVPTYYLTLNVAAYQPGENLLNYFSLDTTTYRFLITRHNKPVGIANKNQKMWGMYNFNASDSMSFESVRALNKEPIGFKTSLGSLKPGGGSISQYGFLSGGRIMLANCVSSKIERYNVYNSKERFSYVEKGCAIQSAEAYYIKSGGQKPFSLFQLEIRSMFEYVNKGGK